MEEDEPVIHVLMPVTESGRKAIEDLLKAKRKRIAREEAFKDLA